MKFCIFLLQISSSSLVERECNSPWGEEVLKLRELFPPNNIDGYLIPSEDSHLSEYVAPEYARRAYISGLKGSAGEAVVLADSAAIKTDSRYCEALQSQVDCNWTPYCPGTRSDLISFIAENVAHISAPVIGADPFLFTKDSWEYYQLELEKHKIGLASINVNLVDTVWDASGNRPSFSNAPIFIHDQKYSGRTIEEKLADITKTMTQSDYLVVTRLDSIAWALNLRSLEVPYSPVFFGYLIISKNGDHAFYPRNYEKITDELTNHLCSPSSCIAAKELYSDIAMEINKLSGIVWVPKTGTTYGILNALAENVVTLDNSCPVEYLKSIKNIVEQEGMKRSNLYDSVAISEALMNVEERLQKQTTITELDVVYNLVHLRKEIDPDYYKGESECLDFFRIFEFATHTCFDQGSTRNEQLVFVRLVARV